MSRRTYLIQLEFKGASRVIPYDEGSAGSFLVSRIGKKPSTVGLSKLKEGMEIYCARDNISLSVQRAQTLIKPQYERELRRLSKAIRHIGDLSRAVSHVINFIRENRLGRSFDREYDILGKKMVKQRRVPKQDSWIKYPYQEAKDYWSVGPSPSKGDYAPHYPFSFRNLSLFADTATVLTKSKNSFSRYSADIKTVKKLGRNRKVEKLVNGVRGTLISLAAGSGKIEGTYSQNLGSKYVRSTRGSRSSPSSGIPKKYLKLRLRLQERLGNQLKIKRNTVFAKIKRIEKVERESRIGAPRRGTKVYPMPKMRFFPLRIKGGTAISDTIMNSLPIRRGPKKRRKAKLISRAKMPSRETPSPAATPQPLVAPQPPAEPLTSPPEVEPAATQLQPSGEPVKTLQTEPKTPSQDLEPQTAEVPPPGFNEADLSQIHPDLQEPYYYARSASMALEIKRHPLFIHLFLECARKLANSGNLTISSSPEVAQVTSMAQRLAEISPAAVHSSQGLYLEFLSKLGESLEVLRRRIQ